MERKNGSKSLQDLYTNPDKSISLSFSQVVWSDEESNVGDYDSSVAYSGTTSMKESAASQSSLDEKLPQASLQKYSYQNTENRNVCVTASNLTEVTASSLGSQSENTDSTKTVVESLQSSRSGQKCHSADKPCSKFVVGGIMMSPRTGGIISSLKYPSNQSHPNYKGSKSSQPLSLPSIASFDSTHFPDSSECVTSPTALSVSSFASSRKLEWDSGADLGYTKKSKASSSLSTLERLAIGNSASYLSLEQPPSMQPRTKAKKRNYRKVLSKSKSSKRKHHPSKSVSSSSSSPDQKSVIASSKCVTQTQNTFNKKYSVDYAANNNDFDTSVQIDSEIHNQVLLEKNAGDNVTKKVPDEIIPVSCASSESKTALASINLALKNLSLKLEEHVNNIVCKAANPKLEQYKRIQDYIRFVGTPGENEDEINTKQSIADIIVRTLGELQMDSDASAKDTDLSGTCSLPDTVMAGEHSGFDQELHSYPMERCTTPGGTIVCVPYRPPTASRTYFVTFNEASNNNQVEAIGRSKSPETENSIDCEIAFSRQLPAEPGPSNILPYSPPIKQAVSNKECGTSKSPCIEDDHNTGIYQDFHGNVHIAHQPPGYNADSSSRDSTSSHTVSGDKSEIEEPVDLVDHDEHPNIPRLWTSTGSESAYETIREKDRNIQEEVASSFEFYSTSPRDLREPEIQISEQEREHSFVGDDSSSSQKNDKIVDEVDFFPDNLYKDLPLKTSSPMQAGSSESGEVSSSTSVIHMQKKLYVKRIKKYIKTLEGLERRLAMKSAQSSRCEPSSSRTISFRKSTEFPREQGSFAGNAYGGESSEDYGGDSLVIHRTQSIKRPVSPVKVTVPATPKTVSSLNKLSEIGGLSKLVRSKNIPGEERPHRYLIKQKKSSESQNGTYKKENPVPQSRLVLAKESDNFDDKNLREFGQNFPSIQNLSSKSSPKRITKRRTEIAVQTGSSLIDINLASSKGESSDNFESKSQRKSTRSTNNHKSDHSETEVGVEARRKEYRKPVKLFIPLKKNRSAISRRTSASRELIEMNKENEILTLQEALSLAKPSYIQAAENRRKKIQKKAAVRQQTQEYNHDALAQLPDSMKTSTILKKFIVKREDSPLFDYKSMRAQNERLYNLLPEASYKTNAKKKTGLKTTNRLMSTMYSQKLQKKVLKGKVSHGHQQMITPSR